MRARLYGGDKGLLGERVGCSSTGLWLTWILFCLLSPAYIAASALDANGIAAHGDGTGLQITPGSACSSPVDELVDSPSTVTGNFEGCDSLTAQGVQVTGTTTFFAGREIRLGSAFSVEPGAILSAQINNQLSPFAFVRDDTATSETKYSASFYFNRHTLSQGPGDSINILQANDEDGNSQFYLSLGATGLVLHARLENDSYVNTAASPISLPANGWIEVKVDWKAGSGTGELIALVNGFSTSGLANLNNLSSRVDGVRLGAVKGVTDATTGSFFLDDFSSWR